MVASYLGVRKARTQNANVQPVKDQSGSILDMLLSEPLPDRLAVASAPAPASETAAILDALMGGAPA